jgi:hypothetical protein
MAKFTDYYKFITPQTATTIVQDSQAIDGSAASFGQYSWQNRLVQGSFSRIARYREYENMDADAEVARALDIIAEEMCPTSATEQIPMEVIVNGEAGQQTMSEIELLTIKTALREWCNLHEWRSRLFKVCRNAIKYGDCVFRKRSAFERWEWIPPGNILGAVVDEHNVTKIRGFQIREDTKEPRPIGGSLAAVGSSTGINENATIIPSDEVVRFSIDDDMSDSAPFGDSVLRPVVKAFKQKDMLEDCILIYRMTRAPERRVFKIEVGKMPPQRIKQYLEQVKNEFRQKKVPTSLNGQDQVESVYNPMSTQEDYWFAKTPTGGSDVTHLPGGCLSMDTEVVLLDGSVKSLSDLTDDYQSGVENWTFSTDCDTGEIVPGIISWAGVTQSSAEVIRLVFSNGETLICTPDHKFPIIGKGLVEAEDLIINEHMIAFNYQYDEGEHQVYQANIRDWVSVDQLIGAAELNLPDDFEQLSRFDSFANRELPMSKNLKLISKERLSQQIEVGTLTIDIDEELHDHHNFALAIGLFTQNSNLGEITDLDYWSNKVIRGLRVPVSWMQFGKGSDAQSNDGRPGQSYVEEIRFALFVERLQQHINKIIDREFKYYLSACSISIEKSSFFIKLMEPMNFRQYRQAEIDQMLLNNLQAADQIQYFSKRYILSRFMQLTDSDITTNEMLARQEQGLVATPKLSIVELYGRESAGVTMGSDFDSGAPIGGGGGGFDMNDVSDTGEMAPDMAPEMEEIPSEESPPEEI